VPDIKIIDHETPSPHTVLGQKGTGESGYLGAPAAIANAVNDALKPLGISLNTLPLKASKLADMIAEARAKSKR
jgi:2-furoyl-CoA dehydrogenase large subunit